jgi:septal ring factor EnvC (AmiA/AmiB activator)
MSSTALIATGAVAFSYCSAYKANISLVLSIMGMGVALIFGLIAKGGNVDSLEYVLYGLSILFALLCGISYMYRSMERQLGLFSKENNELQKTREGLDQENDELKKSRIAIDKENDELRETRIALDRENEELSSTTASLNVIRDDLDAENGELKVQVGNLNLLHNKSVDMMRQFALYGDDCKTLGHDLKDISSELKHTDDSLGLTADELDKKVKALDQIVTMLSQSVA